jgi:hypothetical protein
VRQAASELKELAEKGESSRQREKRLNGCCSCYQAVAARQAELKELAEEGRAANSTKKWPIGQPVWIQVISTKIGAECRQTVSVAMVIGALRQL